jgi:hypothetical protein
MPDPTRRNRPERDSGLRTHEDFTLVLRRAGYSDEFISEVLGQLSDPINSALLGLTRPDGRG